MEMKNKTDGKNWRAINGCTYDVNYLVSVDRHLSWDNEDKYTIGYRNKKGEIYVYKTRHNWEQGKGKTKLYINGTEQFSVNLKDVFETFYLKTKNYNGGITFDTFKSVIDKDDEGLELLILQWIRYDDAGFELTSYDGYGARVPYNDYVTVKSSLGSLNNDHCEFTDTKVHKVIISNTDKIKIKKENKIKKMVI